MTQGPLLGKLFATAAFALAHPSRDLSLTLAGDIIRLAHALGLGHLVTPKDGK